MMFNEIRFERFDNIAVLTLNRPDTRNAISTPEIIEEIETACNTVNADATARVLVITGADPAFSSGGNIKDMREKKGMFGGTPAQIMANYRKNIQRIPIAVHGIELPTIAAVNGPAIGAGCDLALMCDIRIASEKARIGETFLNIGLIPGDGGAWFLPRAVGMAKACELTFTGDIIDAAEAERIGMVNRVVPHVSLMEETMALARKISQKPPEALRMAKRLLYSGQNTALAQHLDQSAAFQALCHCAEEHHEALCALIEKRDPSFKNT
ncbi:MAG: crotonase/enoyl-CoA hydratase family protein [Desulfosalsimonadaceae bacterium]